MALTGLPTTLPGAAWKSRKAASGFLVTFMPMKFKGVKANDPNYPNKITNLFGYCGGQIYYDTSDLNLSGKILTNIYGKQVGHFTVDASHSVYISDCNYGG